MTDQKTATFVRGLGWKTDAALYKLSSPFVTYDDEAYTHVIASSVIAFDHGGPETLVFPAQENGDPINMGDIAGGRGYMSHEKALRDMGYELQ